MSIIVKRESENTKAQLVTPTYMDKDNKQIIAGSENPLITIDVNHHRNHEGIAYFMWASRGDGNELPNDGTLDVVIASNANTIMHMTYGGFCGGDAELYLYEGTVASGGSSITPINRNRNTSNTTGTASILNPTISTLGTLLDHQILVAGQKKQSSGGSVGSLEYILAPLTNYLFRIENVSGASQLTELILEWYE